MKYLVVSLILIAVAGGFYLAVPSAIPESPADSGIRYVAIGDSYTIGEGIPPAQNWPSQLVNHLQQNGIAISLVANPAVTGWTTQQALDRELPILKRERAEFVTIQIGVNDYVQGVSAEQFRINFQQLLDGTLQVVAAQRVVAVTIPDYSVTPVGARYGDPTTTTAGVQQFNAIIAEEAARRGIAVADVFALSQAAGTRPELITTDGLHPSAIEYTRWEAVVYPLAKAALAL